MSLRTIRLILHGLGNVNRRVLRILHDKEGLFHSRYGMRPLVVGVVDSRGAAWDAEGLDTPALIELKAAGQSVAQYPAVGQPAVSGTALLGQVEAGMLLEASPLDIETGQPGLDCIRSALSRGMHVVTANKGPLILAYQELTDLARAQNVELKFSATVGGGLPAVNIGQRDLAGTTILRLEGILNLTTHYILSQMSAGVSLEEALAQAQAEGHAEADSRLDVEGWDAAAKLVILANSVLGQPTTLADVEVTGIAGVTYEEICRARAERQLIKLLASAERGSDGRYTLRVAPTWLPLYHPLARLTAHQMGIAYQTDISGTITAVIDEEDPMPTAAAMVRDLISIAQVMGFPSVEQSPEPMDNG
jgi:homoserine dehydrogenase